MSETIFGKILTGEIPSFKVYEDCLLYTSPSPRDT
ncbi:hypothetical protein NMF41_20470, partial [Acinetobacter baumannii]|nr:hypothetical protein [Acinetobacter baumannii]